MKNSPKALHSTQETKHTRTPHMQVVQFEAHSVGQKSYVHIVADKMVIADVRGANHDDKLVRATNIVRACNAHDELMAALQRAHDHMAVDVRFKHSQTGKQIISALAKARNGEENA